MRGLRPYYLLFLITYLFFSGLVTANAAILSQCPANIIDPVTGETDNPGIVCKHLAAGDGFANMADGYLQYIFGFSDVTGVSDDQVLTTALLGAELVSPTIVVKEGQDLYLTLSNVGMVMRPDLFDPHTVHWHGFPNASAIFDGVPGPSVSTNMGTSFTYYYKAAEPGTYLYHCHVEVTEHMQMGMYGNIWVEPAQNGTSFEYPPSSGRFYTKFAYNDGDGSTGYNVAYPIQLSSIDPDFHDANLAVQPLPFANMKDRYALINGRGYPDTINILPIPNTFNGNESQKIHSLIVANQGERILLRIQNLSVTEFFTVTVLGIPMKVVGKGARILRSSSGENLYYDTTSVNVGGGEAYDVILDTDGVSPGTYFLYTTNLNFLSNNNEDYGGLMTEIIIN